MCKHIYLTANYAQVDGIILLRQIVLGPEKSIKVLKHKPTKTSEG